MDPNFHDYPTCLTWQNCSSHLPSGSKHLVGWVPESPGRGTLTLIWACLLTIFLCTWVVIHPRIDKRRKFRILHKLALSVKTLVAPEFIAVEAAQEWTQAQRIVRDCAHTTGNELKLIHAFYIGMFGIRYRTGSGKNTKVLWPNQFIWLLEQGILKWSDREEWGLTTESIEDRSNADGTAKFFAVAQVAWFVAQSIIRAAHNLPLAPFESMTLGYIPLFFLAYYFWWVKPKDIETPAEIELLQRMNAEQTAIFESMAINDDFDDEGSARQKSCWSVWYLTPRIFEKEARDERVRRAQEEAESSIQHKMEGRVRIMERARPLPNKPTDNVVIAHWDPELYRSKKLWPVICLFGVSFPALHLISWDGSFPTFFELWLWRGAAIASIVTMLVFIHFERIVIRWRDPLTLLKICPPGLYLISRVIMMAEAFAAFRASNPAIYETFVVSNYWLHLV